MSKDQRVKLVPATTINFIAELNELLIENARKKTSSEIELPGMIDRAYILFHETGVLPFTDQIQPVPDAANGIS